MKPVKTFPAEYPLGKPNFVAMKREDFKVGVKCRYHFWPVITDWCTVIGFASDGEPVLERPSGKFGRIHTWENWEAAQ